MEIFEAKKITDEILGGVSSISHPNNDLNTIIKPNLDETVTVEKTEISVVEEDKDVFMENLNEGLFGNLDDNNGVNDEENNNGEKLESAEEEQGDHDYVVGDFVWGKIKSHPWWPGQVYDPSDASDYAARLNRKGRLLVAYFGDGSFSWCSPSQLKPFINHFPEMSKQSDSKKFVHAVQTALEEVSRLVEVALTCKCGTVNRAEYEYAGVLNKGIKEGVPAPKGSTVKFMVDRIDPVELVLTLKRSAIIDPGSRSVELEFTLLKSCLNAFYSRKCGHVLLEYNDPKFIAGLEHETRNEAVADSDSNKKTKSVAELLREDEPKVKKTKTAKDGGCSKRKMKALVVSVTPKSGDESDGGGNGGGGVEEETMSPRQRKKSKYLSPPYLSPIGNAKFSVLGSASGSGTFKEPKPEPENIPEVAAKHLEDSSKKSSGRKARQNRGIREGSDSQDEENSTIAVDVNVNKVLQGLLRVALDPTSFLEKNKNLPAVTDFMSSYRSSMFVEGSGNRSDGKITGGVTSELGFIKQKLEWVLRTVQACEESKMSADVKVSLEGGLQEVLQKVGKMKGK